MTDTTMPSSRRVITLPSGGTIILTIAANVLALSKADRAFVCDLVDRMEAHEASIAASNQAAFYAGTYPAHDPEGPFDDLPAEMKR